jgi:hypothetical protein
MTAQEVMMSVSVEIMAGRLLRYLLTWHDQHGAIHGVHTHPVWRIHPGVMEDHYTGYSAWGAPYLLGLADLVEKTGADEVWVPSERLVRWLLTTQLPTGKWDNAGAEFGRCFNDSPVDNMLQDLSLASFAGKLRARLGEATFREIDERVRRNLDLYRLPVEQIPARGCWGIGTVNQDCAGIWAVFEWMNAFGWDATLEAEALAGLDIHLKNDLIHGLPDAESAGMLRGDGDPDYIEPAEYYGVIIPAYIWGYRRSGDRRYLDAALALARHVMRTTWTDAQGCRRLYRNYHKINGVWRVCNEPMLISGGGLACRALRELQALTPEAEIERFLTDMTATCTHYQNPYGFIAQATGWHDDFDIICGTVWQCHDLAWLAGEVCDPAAFLAALREPAPDLGVVIGWLDCWIENATQWAIQREWSMGFGYVGAKTADHGYPSIPTWCGPRHPPMELAPKVEVRLVDGTFVIHAPGYKTIAVLSLYGKPWERADGAGCAGGG